MLFHHAYLCEGSSADFQSVAVHARSMLDLANGSRVDIIERQYDKFGIDDARKLTELASLRSIGEKSLFVLGIASITNEAQQAMLKLLEEPREGLTFVLLLPRGIILPTLRSRMMEFPKMEAAKHRVSKESQTPGVRPLSAEAFLNASPKERSELLAKILKADDAKDQMRHLIDDIEAIAYNGNSSHKYEVLSEIAAMRSYVNDRSSSLKMIGEHLAAVLPKI